MFTWMQQEEKPSVIDPVIEQLISEMAAVEAGTKEYTSMVADLEALMRAKAMEPRKEKISANTKAIVGANLAGIGMILLFERLNVITSKGLGFVVKPRV